MLYDKIISAKHSKMVIKKNHTHTILAFSIFFCFFFSWNIFMAMAADQNTTNYIPVNVGVVLDLDKESGKIYLSCIKMALLDFYASHSDYHTRLLLNTGNSKHTVVGAAAAALDLIKNEEVQAILGPETSMQASFVVNLGDQACVPIITFSASSPSLTSLGSSYFFRITQTDSHQVQAISSIVEYFGWRQVVPIYVDNTYGEGVIPFLIDALQDAGAHVPYRSVIPPSATDDQIYKELYKLMTMQTRVFIVHMMPRLCSRLFTKAKEIGMMSKGYVWIMTNGVGNRLRSMGSVLNSMQGVLGVETDVPITRELKEFTKRWKRQFQQDNPTIIDAKMDVFGYRAYDAAFALAMAVEQVGSTTTTSFGFKKGNLNDSFNSSTDLDTFKVSQNGPKLSNALSNTSFEGIAGEFKLVDRQLQSSTFKIVNVNGDGARPIAFWTPENGMVRTLNSSTNTSSTTFSTYKCNLGPIIWPGESLSVPKGWEIPTYGNKKLRIGVPVKDGFTEFVNVTKDPKTNTSEVTGFSIDVFMAAVEILAYDLPYEFIPFENSDGTSANLTYNDLVYQVYLQNFDAVVGDITIRANRSLYVDFTMPYTESGIAMVAPFEKTRGKNAWVFLKPLTSGLWLTITFFFAFIAFVVWVLEHRINDDFRGPPSYQVSTSFWFSFSTMVFSHRERVVSNSARVVMLIWFFVMLILTQSYTANLASLLTVQQLKPTVTDIKDLLRNEDNVGYIQRSYIYELLIQLGFDDSKLKVMKSMEDCNEALSKGTAKGGISALVDGTPNLKLFVAKYCPKYTMIGPILKTSGYGFAFQKRSPLLADMSQAILNVTEGEKILNIEDKWFKKDIKCQDPTLMVSSNSLGLDSFWGLFLIAGVASIFALIMFVGSFVYNQRQVLMLRDSRASTWTMIQAMLKNFDEKDLSFHTFRSSQQRDGIGSNVGPVGDAVKASPNNNWSESPVSSTNHSDTNYVYFGEEQTPSPGQASSPEIAPTMEFAITTDQERHTN